jgi:hypothetical protein
VPGRARPAEHLNKSARRTPAARRPTSCSTFLASPSPGGTADAQQVVQVHPEDEDLAEAGALLARPPASGCSTPS